MSDVRTAEARNIRRRRRSLNSPDMRFNTESNPDSERIATRADRSAGCSYARELIPGSWTRLRSGVVMLGMLRRCFP
ncbi:hypothetical protein Aple_055220 [Acrocarpospora pleiomorpha]|uniref:Uncharacterized protein n=1 Tax=Acrocarpospora pleiomorpha TaxID=90975 RepID=A0A5M3XN13_9ACTN|nr:hypothetical protein Aple_055220 [Acrocarpospora pleiomorpha]